MKNFIIPEEALAQHTAAVGKTGSGKTSTSKLMVEHVVAEDYRVCILDPIKSDWWGITSSADGKKPGLPFKILGGPHGHVPLHSSAGAVIGQLVGSGKLPLSIIDMADFEAGGLQRFFVDFAPALMKSMRGVLYLVIEEAHEFAPKERAGFGAESMAIHFAKKLATAGRSKGIRLIVATQRVQSLHNAVLGSCDTLIAHRLTTPADQEPVLKWLKANTDKETLESVSRSLSSLPRGTGWMCSGEERIFKQVAFPKFKTYDNAATPEKDGAEVQVKTAAVDQDELRSIIGDAVKDAEANDPKRLHARIAELEKAAKKVTPAVDPQAVARARAEGQETGYAAGFDDGVKHMKPYENALMKIEKDAADALDMVGPPEGYATGKAKNATFAIKNAPIPPKIATPRPVHASSGPGEVLPMGEKAILIALAQYPDGCTREQITVLSGYKRSSRDTYLQRLRARGYMAENGDRIVATDGGVRALGGDFQPLPTGEDLRAHWLEKLPEGESKILGILMTSYPDAVDRDALSDATGYKRSSRDTYLQRLRARQLVDDSARGMVKASDDLFLEAA